MSSPKDARDSISPTQASTDLSSDNLKLKQLAAKLAQQIFSIGNKMTAQDLLSEIKKQAKSFNEQQQLINFILIQTGLTLPFSLNVETVFIKACEMIIDNTLKQKALAVSKKIYNQLCISDMEITPEIITRNIDTYKNDKNQAKKIRFVLEDLCEKLSVIIDEKDSVENIYKKLNAKIKLANDLRDQTVTQLIEGKLNIRHLLEIARDGTEHQKFVLSKVLFEFNIDLLPEKLAMPGEINNIETMFSSKLERLGAFSEAIAKKLNTSTNPAQDKAHLAVALLKHNKHLAHYIKTRASTKEPLASLAAEIKRAQNYPALLKPAKEISVTNVDVSRHSFSFLGKLVGKFLLRAQSLPKTGGFLARQLGLKLSEMPVRINHETFPVALPVPISYENFTVALNDGTKLDTLEIVHNFNRDKKGYLIHFQPNMVNYDDLALDREILEDAAEFNCIYFNYRNVGKSKGDAYSSQDMVNDGIAMVQRLLNNGVPPDLIFLTGGSIGAATCALVYQHFQQRGIYLGYCYNDRSFDSLVVAASNAVGYAAQQETNVKALNNPLLSGTTSAAVALANWEMPAGKAFADIPSDRKGGVSTTWVSPRNIVGGDGIISENAQMKDPTIKKYVADLGATKNQEAHNVSLDDLTRVDDELGETVTARQDLHNACIKRRMEYLTLTQKYQEVLQEYKNDPGNLNRIHHLILLHKKILTNPNHPFLNEVETILLQRVYHEFKQHFDPVFKKKHPLEVSQFAEDLIYFNQFIKNKANKDDTYKALANNTSTLMLEASKKTTAIINEKEKLKADEKAARAKQQAPKVARSEAVEKLLKVSELSKRSKKRQ